MQSDNVNLPINVGILIFSNLTRDDLDICRTICRSWKYLVDYGKKELPKRPIDLIISSQYEFSFALYYKNSCKKYAFKKYFRDM